MTRRVFVYYVDWFGASA